MADVAEETEFQFPRDLLLKVAEIVYQQNSDDNAKAKLPPVPGLAS
ncbi:MAG: hypothetical protein WA709_20910 [Stellaceae bacterium]